MAEKKKLSGPDFAEGVSIGEFADGGMVQGHANGEAILVARRGDAYFAIGASCTHYGGPLAEGLIAGDTVRCPWHHACFNLRTGEALRAPALDPVSSWKVETSGGKLFVREKQPGKKRRPFRRRRQKTSSSSAAALQATPRQRCCGPTDILAALR